MASDATPPASLDDEQLGAVEAGGVLGAPHRARRRDRAHARGYAAFFLPRFSAHLDHVEQARRRVRLQLLDVTAHPWRDRAPLPTASASFSIEPNFDLISLPTSWRRRSFLFDAASRRALTVVLVLFGLGDRAEDRRHAVDQLLLALVLVLLPGERGLLRGHGRLLLTSL